MTNPLSMRLAVIGVFASFGLVVATWAVHLPTVKKVVELSSSMLGGVVLILGCGALVGMQLSGVLVDKFGSGPIAVAGAASMAVGVNIPLAATSGPVVAAGAFVCGIATGLADVAMNAAAVDVERIYGRPIMASFHGVFSVANVVGAAVGSAGFASGTRTPVTVAGITIVCLIMLTAASTVLVRGLSKAVDAAPEPDADDPYASAPDKRSGQVLMLGILAFLLMLAEGSATDWSSLHAQEHLHSSPSLGALAFGTFMGAMTIGRFLIDRVVLRVGRPQVVRLGCILAAIGLLIVFISPFLALTLAGWAVVGFGLSGCIPQVFTAAGNINRAHEGRALSRVVGIGYVAVLGGPAVIGWLADQLSLNTALLLPVFAVLIAGCLSNALEMTVDGVRESKR